MSPPAELEPELARLRALIAAHEPERIDFGPEIHGFRDAAVLVPVVPRQGGLQLLFTQRPESMRTHSGQISFPGGRRDDTDADLAATAVRETEEELGVPRGAIEILGRLSQVPTPSRYVITPYVGILRPPAAGYQPSAHEVADAFEVSLDTLRHPDTLRDRGQATKYGYRWHLVEYHPPGRVIWGATARMINELLTLWR